jgi:hypothetical protein
MWYSKLEKTFISWHILHQHWYTCPITLPMRRNPQHRSILTVVSANSATEFHRQRLSNVLERISLPSCEPLYATNTSHRKQETFLYEYPFHWVILPTKTHSRTLFFGSILFKHVHPFDYWNQTQYMRMRVCHLACHEARLCCCLVIHIENLLRPLQLFYFHLWPIYWPSFIYI